MNKKFCVVAGFIAIIFSFSFQASAQRPIDREISQTIRFARAKSSAVIRKRIPLGTTHLYTLPAQQ